MQAIDSASCSALCGTLHGGKVELHTTCMVEYFIMGYNSYCLALMCFGLFKSWLLSNRLPTDFNEDSNAES